MKKFRIETKDGEWVINIYAIRHEQPTPDSCHHFYVDGPHGEVYVAGLYSKYLIAEVSET